MAWGMLTAHSWCKGYLLGLLAGDFWPPFCSCVRRGAEKQVKEKGKKREKGFMFL